MSRALGWLIIVLVGLVLVINGLIMLISPRTWFRLPSWIGFQGGLTEEKYGSGIGAIQVRLLGGIFVAVVLWVIYDSTK
jgi:hypothetical protein